MRFMLFARALLLGFFIALSPAVASSSPLNIVLLIGDGMGPEQIRAGGMYLNGEAGSLGFEDLPFQSTMTTNNAANCTTDSAASATAMATGVKVNNGVISMAIPGDGAALPTVMEHYKSMGKATGLVTTTFVSDATVAAFAAHNESRGNLSEIFNDYITISQPDVILGGLASTNSPPSSGYTVVATEAELFGVDFESTQKLFGHFGTGKMPYEHDGMGSLPSLSEMAIAALSVLDNDPDGFMMVIEGGRIDHACHSNDVERMVEEVAEFSRTVDAVLGWASGDEETLILVTSDHETGGLEVLANAGQGVAPTVSWSTTGHTKTSVKVFASGPWASTVDLVSDNTDLYLLLTEGTVFGISYPEGGSCDSGGCFVGSLENCK